MNFSANPTHTHRDIYMLIHNLAFPILHIYVHIILSFYPLYFKKNVHVYVYVCTDTHTSHINFFLAGFPHKQSLAKLLPELSKGHWGSRKPGRRLGALQSACFSLWWCCWGSQGILSSFMHSWVQMTGSKLAITLCILRVQKPQEKEMALSRMRFPAEFGGWGGDADFVPRHLHSPSSAPSHISGWMPWELLWLQFPEVNLYLSCFCMSLARHRTYRKVTYLLDWNVQNLLEDHRAPSTALKPENT